jgi:hypothetical protein
LIEARAADLAHLMLIRFLLARQGLRGGMRPAIA